MEAYTFESGPYDKNGNPTKHYAVRETKEERAQTAVAMANPEPGSKRKPMYAAEEIQDGILVRRWYEYAG